MALYFLKKISIVFLIFIFFLDNLFAAVTQILNDNFFLNPAELNIINKSQLIAGNVFINPSFNFKGTSYGVSGSANSNVNNVLPYILISHRFDDRLVLGFNVLPSSYGHLNWGSNSIVEQDSTLTKVLYYRFSLQGSYQFSDNLAFGLGFNVEDNIDLQVNFVVPGQGNQINRVSAINYTGDIGIYYKINPQLFLTIAGYTQVSSYGHGASSAGFLVNKGLTLNIIEAPVIYAGLKYFPTEKWFLEEKIYWSGWSLQHNINFNNTTSGSYIVPVDWKDVWSFQTTTRYELTDNYAFIGSMIYETKPVNLATNEIGYPLAAFGALAAGLEFNLAKGLSAQTIYSYGAFLPNSPVDALDTQGVANAQFQSAVLQFTYKL